MKSNKIILLTIILLLLVTNIQSQSIIFCESVDAFGKPVNAADTFDVSPQGGMLSVLVKPGHPLNTDVIFYQIYSIYGASPELNNIERQEVQGEWLFCWIHLNFNEEGKYRINAVSADNTVIGTGDVYIKVDKK
jgi:hypothetical protein